MERYAAAGVKKREIMAKALRLEIQRMLEYVEVPLATFRKTPDDVS